MYSDRQTSKNLYGHHKGLTANADSVYIYNIIISTYIIRGLFGKLFIYIILSFF